MSTAIECRHIFTTGQIARIVRVAPRTVTRWIDSGLLGGYTLPDSDDRRVTRDVLVRFLDDHGMPALATLEEWALSPDSPAAFDRRVRPPEMVMSDGEEIIRASAATACAHCDRSFGDHPHVAPRPGVRPRPLRRLCNGDLVQI